MTRLMMTALASAFLLAPAAMAQTVQSPAPVVIPAPEGAQTIAPAGKSGCSRDRHVMS